MDRSLGPLGEHHRLPLVDLRALVRSGAWDLRRPGPAVGQELAARERIRPRGDGGPVQAVDAAPDHVGERGRVHGHPRPLGQRAQAQAAAAERAHAAGARTARALDLGAAPGGWTRLLLEAGLHVVAVDPARLDPRLAKQPRLEHYRGYAETYLENAVETHKSFDIIVSDMRMDAREAARLLVQASACLLSDGFIISVLKLPHETPEIDPLKNLNEALSLLQRHFAIVQARQLFHNRQEVTVLTARPQLM